MRDIYKVIDAIKAATPATETTLHQKLDWFRTDCSYKAPEQITEQWVKFMDILNTWAMPIDTAWKQQIADIFEGKAEVA